MTCCYIKGRLVAATGSFGTELQKVAAPKRGLGLLIVYGNLTRPTFGMADNDEDDKDDDGLEGVTVSSKKGYDEILPMLDRIDLIRGCDVWRGVRVEGVVLGAVELRGGCAWGFGGGGGRRGVRWGCLGRRFGVGGGCENGIKGWEGADGGEKWLGVGQYATFQHSRINCADIFYKSLARERIEFLINKLGIRSFTPDTLKQLADEVEE
ncbi:hypothetical protein Tco_0559953 [Tanacetum coccineum]